VNGPVPTGYELLTEGNTSVLVRSSHRRMLQRNGLFRFRDFHGCAKGEVVNAHGSREVVRLTLDGEMGPHAVYLKRFGPMHLKDALKDLVCFRRVQTLAQAEFAMLCACRDADVPVPEAIACGTCHRWGRDRASFLMVEALPSGRPLDDALETTGDAGRRGRLIASVAAFVRRMHDAGITHADLFAKHLFVDEWSDGTWGAAVIDLQRACREPSASATRRGRDLAALLVSIDPTATTPRERRAFLLGYLNRDKLTPEDLAFLRRCVLPRARKLCRRTVYRAWQPVLETS